MIICAALNITVDSNITPGGKREIIVHGLRHGDCYYQAKLMNIPTNSENTVEGFVDSRGIFYDRFEAYDHAAQIGQISPTTIIYKQANKEYELYSEDLY